MPCWPDIWEHVKRELPRLGVFAAAIGYVALVVLLFWAPKLRKRWLRIASRVLGVAAAVPLAFLGPAFFLGLLLASGNPPTATRIVYSQNGQEARLSYDSGFLGRDYTEVALKTPSSCRHTAIFWHDGPSSLEDVQVDWIDNEHLQLKYHARPTDPVHCEQKVGQVAIVCTSLRWPNP
jgi:hypothetical protein